LAIHKQLPGLIYCTGLVEGDLDLNHWDDKPNILPLKMHSGEKLKQLDLMKIWTLPTSTTN